MIIAIRDDMTCNVTTEDGLLECELPNYNPETLVPFASVDEATAFAASIEGNVNYFVPKLSDEEKAAVAAANDLESILRKRAAEYPPITDYLDGIVKGDAEQVQAYIDACLAVKAKYPKPDAP
jgi:hypothetical protein